ncbi:MAG: hypothetical protein KDC98_26345, partial [Planctomycetes bacterium]|nr:hypothetical protein [Planctomycetota bacterium]
MVLRTVVAGFVAVAALVAQAPPGFKTYENKLAELAFYYPVAFKEVPVPPTEQTLVARYVLADKPRELKKVSDQVYKAVEPQILVYRFALPTVLTGAAASAPAADDKPATVREAMEERSRVSSWEEFVKRFQQWRLVE